MFAAPVSGVRDLGASAGRPVTRGWTGAAEGPLAGGPVRDRRRKEGLMSCSFSSP